MDFTECKFSIKRIKKSTDNDYIRSLSIYNDTTPYEIKTPTNEITYWLNNQSLNSPFEIYIFSVFINDINIGFLMLSYIKYTKVMIYEYLAVLEHYRVYTVFLTFENLFRNYFREKNIEISYYLTEISFKNDGKSIDRESLIFEKMLCVEEYGKIKALYYNLPIGLNNHESDFKAYMYVRDVNNSNSLDPSTYLDIVHSIYYDYCVSWYHAILSSQDIKIYKEQVDSYYKKISNDIYKKKTITIERNNCSIFDDAANILHSELPIVKKSRKAIMWILLVLSITIIPIIVVWIYNVLLSIMGLSITKVGTLIVSVLTSIISAITSILSTKKDS